MVDHIFTCSESQHKIIGITSFRENLYCIISEAFQQDCNIKILTVYNTEVLY